MKLNGTALVLASVLLGAVSLSSADVYYACGNYYSDAPAGLKTNRCELKNSRNGTVVKAAQPDAAPAKPLTLAEQQAQLAQKMAEADKKAREENEKLKAETKAENCKAAQLNKDTLEKTNARNKDQLLPKYEQDIAKYCN